MHLGSGQGGSRGRGKENTQDFTWWVAYAALARHYPSRHVHKLLSVQFAILRYRNAQHPRTWPYATGLARWSTPLLPRMTARSTHRRAYSHTKLLTDGWKGGPRHVWSEQRAGSWGCVSRSGETDCKECNTKGAHGPVDKYKQNININNAGHKQKTNSANQFNQ